jgi:hypothetical protein
MKNFNTSAEEVKKEIKLLIIFLIIVFLFNLGIIAYQIQTGYLMLFSYIFITSIISLGILPLAIMGLWKMKRWGLYLAFGLSVFHLLDGIIGFNFIKVLINAIIIYHLYKWRSLFT